MAVPVLETWTANNTGGLTQTTITLTKPSGVANGDLLIMMVGNDETNASTDGWNAVTGWTKEFGFANATGDSSFAIYWREADGTEGATQDVVNDSNSWESYGWYLRISGADTTTPFHQKGTPAAGSSSSHAISGVTTSIADCLAFYLLAFDGGDGAPFSVSGTGWAEVDEEQSGTGGTDASGCFGTKDQATAGATGTATVSCSASDGATFVQFAIAPDAGAGGLAIPVAQYYYRSRRMQ